MIVEIFELNGVAHIRSGNSELSLTYTMDTFTDVSAEQTELKIKQLSKLVELGFNSEQIIELKKQGLL